MVYFRYGDLVAYAPSKSCIHPSETHSLFGKNVWTVSFVVWVWMVLVKFLVSCKIRLLYGEGLQKEPEIERKRKVKIGLLVSFF